MKKSFIRKPLSAQAMQFDGTHACAERIIEWVNGIVGYNSQRLDGPVEPPILFYYGEITLRRTLTGDEQRGKAGTWVVQIAHMSNASYFALYPDTVFRTYFDEQK